MNKMMATVLVTLMAAAVYAGDASYMPTDAERARWTLQDMRSWKIALDAYKIDNKSYPVANSLQEAAAAIQGVYIAKVPVHDAWGRPYVFERTETGFMLVSGGADGKFDRTTWAIPGQQDSLDADAVVSDEAKFWLRSWKFR